MAQAKPQFDLFPKHEHEKDCTKILYNHEQIQKRCFELGAQISKDYKGKELVLVGILKGSFMFLADLTRYITVPHKIDFMIVSSYHGVTQSSNVKISKDVSIDPFNCHIVIVEDLIDSGETLSWLMTHMKSKNCLSVQLCCLLDKQTTRRSKEVQIQYVGWKCPDEWVIGYGMDYNQYYRSLPYVAVLSPEIYTDKNEQKDKKSDINSKTNTNDKNNDESKSSHDDNNNTTDNTKK